MSMRIFFRALSVLMPLSVGFAFAAAGRSPLMTATVFVLASVFTVVGAAAAAPKLRGGLAAAVTPLLLVASAFGFFLILETARARYGLIALVVLLLAVYGRKLRTAASEAAGADVNFHHLVRALHVVSVFFLLAFSFGITTFMHVPALALAAAIGGLFAVVMRETVKGMGIAPREHRVLIAAFGILGVESYAAFSFLPTWFVVNAAAVIILFVLGLHVSSQAIAGTGESRSFRRQIAASLALVAAVLWTARWV